MVTRSVAKITQLKTRDMQTLPLPLLVQVQVMLQRRREPAPMTIVVNQEFRHLKKPF
jgi:hypothetical protein